MTERKVQNKYYPPDYDPSKLLPARALRPKRTAGPRQMSIRMMLPFTMRCGSCAEYLYIATKFNSRCEKVQGNSELGLSSYRFLGSCKYCGGEFSFRTDPEHCDYVLESGGTRSYEAFKDADYAEAEVAQRKAAAEATDESQALENKIYDTAEEMRRLEELGELRSLNRREAKRHEVIHNAIDKLFLGGNDDGDEKDLDDAAVREFQELRNGGKDEWVEVDVKGEVDSKQVAPVEPHPPAKGKSFFGSTSKFIVQPKKPRVCEGIHPSTQSLVPAYDSDSS